MTTEPRTEATTAGRRLGDAASALWWQPNRLAGANAMHSATADVRAAIFAIEAEAARQALEDVAERVRALHPERKSWPLQKNAAGIAEDGYRHWCGTCKTTWPCATVRALLSTKEEGS